MPRKGVTRWQPRFTNILSRLKGKIDLPVGAKVLSVGCQGDGLFLWAEVRPELASERRTFEVYGTGHPMKPLRNGIQRSFIGTALMHSGALVWHVFELAVATGKAG